MEQPLNTIVVGFDFSPQAKLALANALDLAGRNRARVHVVTSLAGHLDTVVTHAPGRDEFEAEGLFRDVENKIDRVLLELPPTNVSVTKEVTMANALVALSEAADLAHADLIAVGISGLSGFEEALVGSTTGKLLRKSRWPVLAAKPGSHWPPRRILCPVDFSPASRRALGWAGEIAQMVGAMVMALHVVPHAHSRLLRTLGMSQGLDDGQMQKRRVDAEEFLRNYLGEVADLRTVTTEAMVVFGRPDEEIIRCAESGDVDLICMGSIGRDGVARVLVGNTAERVLRRLPCSLMTVKPDDFVLSH
jgi:universal stress protein E